MTIPDIIDEVMRDIGASEDSITQCREFALAMWGGTREMKERIFQELSDDEIERYRKKARIFLVAAFCSPEFRNQLAEWVAEERSKN